MQEYSVILTWEAIYDVIGFADYIEASFGKLQADRFQRTIKEQMEKLGGMGKAFQETQLMYRGYVIHKKPFPPSIIFYVVMDDMLEVHILRVLREENGWERTLRQEPEYTYPD